MSNAHALPTALSIYIWLFGEVLCLAKKIVILPEGGGGGGGLAFRDFASNFLANFSPMEIYEFASKNKQQNLRLLAISRI